MNTKNRAGSLLGQGLLAITLLATLGMMTGCGSGGGGGGTPVPDAVPTGYYANTGTADILADDNSTPVSITDLQGMIYNGRLIMLSVARGLSYDGTITVSGNNFSGTVSIYRNGTKLPAATATVDGIINQGSTVSGVLTGTGAGNGSFLLNYGIFNSGSVVLADIGGSNWESAVGGSSTNYIFTLDSLGPLNNFTKVTDGVFAGCDIGGTVTSLSHPNIFSVTMVLTGCTNPAVNGTYTGLTTPVFSMINQFNVMFWGVSNGTYSMHVSVFT